MAGLSDGIGYRDWLAGWAGTKGLWTGGQRMRVPVRGEMDA